MMNFALIALTTLVAPLLFVAIGVAWVWYCKAMQTLWGPSWRWYDELW